MRLLAIVFILTTILLGGCSKPKKTTREESVNDPIVLLKEYNLKGSGFFDKRKDSAYFYYHEGLELARRHKLSGEMPLLLYNIGVIFYYVHDYRTAILYIDSCIQMANQTRDYKVLANACNSLGNIYFDMRDAASSKRLYDSSFRISVDHNFPYQAGVALGNLAKFDSVPAMALSRLREAVTFVRRVSGSEEQLALLYNNIAYHHQNPDSVIANSTRALELVKTGNFPDIEIGAYNNMAYAWLDKGRPDKAEACIRDYAMPAAIKSENLDWQASLSDTYADILIAKGDFKTAVAFEKEAYYGREKAYRQSASMQVRLLSVILEVKQKDRILGEKEHLLAVKGGKLRQTIMIIVILMLAIIAITLGFLIKISRSRLKFQQIQTMSAQKLIHLEEKDKERIAAEIHDLAGPIVMSMVGQLDKLEAMSEPVRAEISRNLVRLSEGLRAISHRTNLVLSGNASLNDLVAGLCEDLKMVSDVRFSLHLPKQVPELQKDKLVQVYRIIQEMMVNGVKYVKNGTIRLTVTAEEEKLFVFYEDNGPGFDIELIKDNGLGITNIFERAKFSGGRATLNSIPGKGTRWTISIPLN
jgi:signal transduction histidine kinase